MKKIALMLIALLAVIPNIFAQNGVEMADTLRSEGKIYVVIAVLLVIFSAVAVYLFILDRKVKKLENDK